MSIALKQDFKFVNISGRTYIKLVDIIRTIVVGDYFTAKEAALDVFDLTVAKLWEMKHLFVG